MDRREAVFGTPLEDGSQKKQNKIFSGQYFSPVQPATVPGMNHHGTEPLARLLALSQDHLASWPEARQLLIDNGLTDESIWNNYRIGASGKDLVAGLDVADREALFKLGLLQKRGNSPIAMPGVLVPTFDPRQPDQPIGFVKVSPAQNNHKFVGPTRGLACPDDIATHERIIITDNPLLMLRLAHAGAVGVILGETPEVLVEYQDWLVERQIVVASYRKNGLAALSAALAFMGSKFQEAFIAYDLWHTNRDTLSLLGIDREKAKPNKPKPIPANAVIDVVAYAHARLHSGEGLELLEKLGVDHARFVEAYGVGYLPKDYHKSMPKALRRAIRHRLVADSLLVPAYDEQGVAVDLMIARSVAGDCRQIPFSEHPSGLTAPKISTAFQEIYATDSFRMAAKLFDLGHENALLLRGPKDAKANAIRLRDAGVRTVRVISRRESDGITDALLAVGLNVEVISFPKSLDGVADRLEDHSKVIALDAEKLERERAEVKAEPCEPEPVEAGPEVAEPLPEPDPSSKPEFVSHDERLLIATFKAGELTYEVETALDCGSKLEVKVEANGQGHRDKFNLAQADKCRRFAQSAANKVNFPRELIAEHLYHLLDMVRDIRKRMLDPEKVEGQPGIMTDERREAALALAQKPDLLKTIVTDFDALGWAGEEPLKKHLLLISISRKLQRPQHGALRSPSAAGKTVGMEAINAITPQEDVVNVSALTRAALYHRDLRHKLLLFSEADGLDRSLIVQLRILLSEGSLRRAGTRYDAATNRCVADTKEAQGPVAFLTSTTRNLDGEILDRCFDLPLDDSPEQTERILKAQRQAALDPMSDTNRQAISERLADLQRVLDPCHVKIPYADRIAFPSDSLRLRREHQRFLGLIQSSALLHQHQRIREGGYVLANEADFELAKELITPLLAGNGEDLSIHGRDVLGIVEAHGLQDFNINDLKAARPQWSRHKFRAGLDELVRLEILACPKRTRPKRYHLYMGLDPSSDIVVSLTDPKPIGELATFGEGVSPIHSHTA